jgi:hypothetical protein
LEFLTKEKTMPLSEEAKEILVVAMANRSKATEVSEKIDAIEAAFNALCDILEASRDGGVAGTLDGIADNDISDLKL